MLDNVLQQSSLDVHILLINNYPATIAFLVEIILCWIIAYIASRLTCYAFYTHFGLMALQQTYAQERAVTDEHIWCIQQREARKAAQKYTAGMVGSAVSHLLWYGPCAGYLGGLAGSHRGSLFVLLMSLVIVWGLGLPVVVWRWLW